MSDGETSKTLLRKFSLKRDLRRKLTSQLEMSELRPFMAESNPVKLKET
jgi:hypothetical protein